jgi:DNA-binding NarL/FixJ family response regulator
MLNRVVELLSGEYEVVGAVRDGQALIEAAAATCPDVIVADISMPILTGIEAANLLCKTGSTAKIVFLSVHEDPDYISASLEAGALGYVIKPRMASDLPVAIRRALEGKRFISRLTTVETS